ncbi:transmembrane trafficking protein, transmembrane protein Tmp21 precursor, putative [Eimeria brunetti]|uniref:Transmembrane trafficking protein, transmembrane protein Tmp21, putative n=1 Tax=Eimeria brunetti TaxID=51314 RepID=U6LTE3_9EIME|nr:transmembrane trafficking protein, transmembrane protein Tmp21 precursor, putative [Eimeria brunetti]
MSASFLPPRWLALVFIFLTCLGCMSTLAFEASIDLGPAQRRCIGEQLSKHVLIVGEFRVSHPAPTVPGGAATGPLLMHVHVTDPANKSPVFQQSSRDRIKTGFTSTKPGVHMFCVKNLSQQQITVDVQLLWGPAARDYSQLAKAEHIDEVMLQLVQLQDKLKLYHNNILFMRERDEQMRQQNEQTATHLIMFCGINIFFLIASSVISGFFFKRFFRSKKII